MQVRVLKRRRDAYGIFGVALDATGEAHGYIEPRHRKGYGGRATLFDLLYLKYGGKFLFSTAMASAEELTGRDRARTTSTTTVATRKTVTTRGATQRLPTLSSCQISFMTPHSTRNIRDRLRVRFRVRSVRPRDHEARFRSL